MIGDSHAHAEIAAFPGRDFRYEEMQKILDDALYHRAAMLRRRRDYSNPPK